MFDYTVKTDKTMKDALRSLEASLKEDQFGVLWHFDIQETLENKGYSFDQPYHVLEVCNPKEAKEVLTRNQMVGYFLPCKIVVYEDDGQVKIGMPRPTAMIQMVNDDTITEFAKGIEDRLISSIDKAV